MTYEPAIEPGRTARDLHTSELQRYDTVGVGLDPLQQQAVEEELELRHYEEAAAWAALQEELDSQE